MPDLAADDHRARRRTRRRRGFPPLPLRAVHIAVLSAFAFAQPIFDILGRNATFFVARRSTSSEIVVFALALTFLPAAILVAAEFVAGLAGTSFARVVHFVFVGALAALVALQALRKSGLLSGSISLILVSAVLGFAAVLLYSETGAAQAFLTALAPAPIVFLALFLGTSDVSKLVFDQKEDFHAVRAGSRTPVVVIIFDELSTIALMDRKQRIDAVRFPNFAALARDATWYRSATGVHTHSESAVPAIMTGQLPRAGQLPTAADHPHSIFTLFGGDYRLHVFESLTRLCPRSLCASTKGAGEASAVEGGAKSLVSDTSVVYLHLLLPAGLARRVPPIGEAWGNFRGLREQSSVMAGGAECGRGLCDFMQSLRPDRRPSLYLVHTLLPHVPWTYLPSGKRYTGSVRNIPGAEATWRHDDWLTLQAYQRYLLQLAYTDRELGLVLERLRAAGIYDRAVVVATADHGLSFRAGEPRRDVTRANLVDLAFVPLFVKLPGQSRGRVVDGYARTIDVLPTIARAAHVRIPWRIDGRPLRDDLPPDGRVTMANVSAPLSVLLGERRAALARQLAVFGTGSRARLYSIGPDPALVGKRVLGLRVEPTDARVTLDEAQLLSTVDLRSDVLPAYVTGRIEGGSGADEELAVALNGTVAATTRSYDDSGDERFAALIPEQLFHAGSNPPEVFSIGRTPGASPLLHRLRIGNSTFVLREREGHEVVDTGGGSSELRVVEGALSGEVHAMAPGQSVILNGWAADLRRRHAADSVAVFLDGRSILVLPVDLRRGRVRRKYGVERAGFRAELPKRLLPQWGDAGRVRIMAISGKVASELRYDGGYLLAGRRG